MSRRSTTAHGARVLAATLVVTAAAWVSGAAPAAASSSTRMTSQAASDALIPFQAEAMLLVELGAFGGAAIPPKLASVHQQWRSYANDLDRLSLIDWLTERDSAGAATLGPLLGEGPVSAEVVKVLSQLSGNDLDAVRAGGSIVIPPTYYDQALNELFAMTGAAVGDSSGSHQPPPTAAPTPSGVQNAPSAPAAPSSPSGQTPTAPSPAKQAPAASANNRGPTAAPGEPRTMPGNGSAVTDGSAASGSPGATAPGSTSVAPGPDPASTPGDANVATAGAARPSTESDSWIWLVAGALGAALLAALGWVIVRARRRAHRSGEDAHREASLAQLLDAGRRLGASLSTIEILQILVDEAQSLTSSEVSMLLLTDGDAVRVAATTAATGDDQGDRSVIRRVLETGMSSRTVSSTTADSASRAIAAAPLVRSGAIGGVLLVARHPDRTYRSSELELLSQLTPLGAAALDAAQNHDSVTEASMTDGLTGLANRRRLDHDLPRALASGAHPVGFVMIDVDHFKHYNDTNGHPAGDAALRQVGELLSQHVRDGDVVYRYGGEEFCVLLPQATSDEAMEVAERVRTAIAEADFEFGASQPNGRLTISVGLTIAEGTDHTAVCSRADQALYAAKSAGRNRVVAAA